MKEKIADLREGWYSNDVVQKKDPIFQVDCYWKPQESMAKLIEHAEKMATNKFILLVEGLSRTINALDIDKNMLEGTLDYPIDLVVFNMAKLVDDDGENEDNSDRVRFE